MAFPLPHPLKILSLEILSLEHAKGCSETENQVNSGRKYQKNTHTYDMEYGGGQGGIYSKSFESTNKKYKYINLTYIQNDIK